MWLLIVTDESGEESYSLWSSKRSAETEMYVLRNYHKVPLESMALHFVEVYS